MGPAKVCGGWETEHKSFSAGSVQNVFPSTLLTLFSDLREDLTRHQIFTQCGSSWTGFHLHLTSDVFLGACGKAFHFHRSRSWWWGWLTLTGPSCLVLLFYLICFSGVGVFQVKYDGQLRKNEDELACDLHCLRVQKNNSGKNGSTDWRFPRSLASCGVENQRRCFWPRRTLSCGYLDPIGWWRRRHLWNAGGEANTNLLYWWCFKVFDPSVSFNTPLHRFRVNRSLQSLVWKTFLRITSLSPPPMWIGNKKMRTRAVSRRSMWNMATRFPIWGGFLFNICLTDLLRFASIQPDCEVDHVSQIKQWSCLRKQIQDGDTV